MDLFGSEGGQDGTDSDSAKDNDKETEPK